MNTKSENYISFTSYHNHIVKFDNTENENLTSFQRDNQREVMTLEINGLNLIIYGKGKVTEAKRDYKESTYTYSGENSYINPGHDLILVELVMEMSENYTYKITYILDNKDEKQRSKILDISKGEIINFCGRLSFIENKEGAFKVLTIKHRDVDIEEVKKIGDLGIEEIKKRKIDEEETRKLEQKLEEDKFQSNMKKGTLIVVILVLLYLIYIISCN